MDFELAVYEDTSRICPVAARRTGTSELTTQFERAPYVIVIAERDPLRGRLCHATIACGANALCERLPRDSHARICKTRYDTGQIDGRRIVNDNDAQIDVTLSQDTCQC